MFFVSACEREIITGDPAIETDGYEIRGFVLDRLGNPMPNVRVLVDYDLQLEDTDTPPDRSISISTAFENITIRVHTLQGQVVRTVIRTVTEAGEFEYVWDELLESGADAPSGAYYVSYMKGGVEVLRYPHLVRDNIVTVTDSVGRYTVPNAALPVGFYPVPQYSGDGTRFFGNYSVTDQVYLTFAPTAPISSIFRAVRAVRDRVVELDVRYN